MVCASASDNLDDIERLRANLANLEHVRSTLRNKLELVDEQIAATNKLISSFGGEPGRSYGIPSLAASAPVRTAILKHLAEKDKGAETKAIRAALIHQFGDSLHPKTHYGVLKRLADEGLASREGSLWSLTLAGVSHLANMGK